MRYSVTSPHQLLLRSALVAIGCVAAACTGSIVEPDGDGSGPGGPGTTGSGKKPGSGMNAQALCKDASVPNVGSIPLRRLTRSEYNNTVRDLLGDASAPASGFAPDEAVGGFDANSIAATSKLQVEDYLDSAEALAKSAVSAKLNELVSCDHTQDSCGQAFVSDFGRRVFRRPLTSDEQASYNDLYKTAKGQWGADTAVELVLRTLLSSPNFLYLAEDLAPDENGAVARVDGYTVASRLSYFLWSSTPDSELLDAAESGKLDSVDGVEQEARRLLADPRAEDAIASFHEQWLGTRFVEEAPKDPQLFPEWSQQLAAGAREETRRFTTHVLLQGDAKLSTLLTADYSFVDSGLAKLYDVSAPAKAFGKVQFDANERSGLLTHASLMASQSGAGETSWVHRGKFVREQLLCDPVKPPPPGVESNDAKDPGRLEDPTCAGCHMKMDPIGVGFDAYSPIGKYRLVDEHGESVNTEGEIVEAEIELDVVGEFTGAKDLASKLAASEDVGKCMAVQWFRYSARRLETEEDACSVARLQEDFAASGYDIRELLVAITKTHAFRYRAVAK